MPTSSCVRGRNRLPVQQIQVCRLQFVHGGNIDRLGSCYSPPALDIIFKWAFVPYVRRYGFEEGKLVRENLMTSAYRWGRAG
jgi:hypothetical protein